MVVFPCSCGFAEVLADVKMCDCHRYWRSGKELLSVSKVLRSAWPFKADFSAAPPEVLENARERGAETDALFSAYVNGTLDAIPPGYRKDAIDLFLKAKTWWDEKGFTGKAQVILADDRTAGTCDIATSHDWIFDLKATSEIEPMYHLQLGAYADLHFATYKKAVKGIGIIHVTKRYATARIIKIDLIDALRDWQLLRDAYYMALRRIA